MNAADVIRISSLTVRGRFRAVTLAGLVSCLLAACAVPSTDQSIAKTTSPISSSKPQIQGAQGPLTVTASKALITKIGNGAGTSDILHRYLAIDEAVAGSPLTADNGVKVLRDGPETFRAISATIRNAKHNLNLEYYTIEDVDLDDGAGGTNTLAELLVAKRQEGVTINLIYDSYGSSNTPAAFFTQLKKAGVTILDYHPIALTNPANMLTINDRDHRKILIADGKVAVVGGVNLSKSYESKSPGSAKKDAALKAAIETSRTTSPKAGQKPDGGAVTGNGNLPGAPKALPEEWRDTAVQIEGPAVAELQTLFRDHWKAEKGPPLDETGFFPKSAAKGNQVVRIIGSAPKENIPRYYVTLISTLRNAESRVWISAAYFVPTPEQMDELMAAAKRGVDVRLLLADNSDSPQAIDAAHTHYSDLLEAGVKIYETKNVVLHSKTVVIDSVWSAIGSSNFDHRSVLYNDEVDAIILGAETAKELEKIYEDGMRISTEIDRKSWEASRPFGERLKGNFSRLWENLL
jgi:cardiolipin synthase